MSSTKPAATSITSATSSALSPKPTDPSAPLPPVAKKKLSREEQEKLKKEEALARKKALDDRLKNRSKRRPAPTDDSVDSSKVVKKVKELSSYEKEVLEISKRSGLSDSGAGMRSLVK